MLLDDVLTTFASKWKFGLNLAGLKCQSSDFSEQSDGSYQHVSRGDGDTFGSQNDSLPPGLIFIRLNSQVNGKIDVVRLIVLRETERGVYAGYGYGVKTGDDGLATNPKIATAIKSVLGEGSRYGLSGSEESFYFNDAEDLIKEQNLYFYLYCQTVTNTKVIEKTEAEIFDDWRAWLKGDEKSAAASAAEDCAAGASGEVESKASIAVRAPSIRSKQPSVIDEVERKKVDLFFNQYLEVNNLIAQLAMLMVHLNSAYASELNFPDGSLEGASQYVKDFLEKLIALSHFVDCKSKEGGLTLEELKEKITSIDNRKTQVEMLLIVSKLLEAAIKIFYDKKDIEKWIDHLRYKLDKRIHEVAPPDLILEKRLKDSKTTKKGLLEFNKKAIDSIDQLTKSIENFMRGFEIQDRQLIDCLSKLNNNLDKLGLLNKLIKKPKDLVDCYKSKFKELGVLGECAKNDDSKLYELLQQVLKEINYNAACLSQAGQNSLHEDELLQKFLKTPWEQLPHDIRQRQLLLDIFKKAVEEFEAGRLPLCLYKVCPSFKALVDNMPHAQAIPLSGMWKKVEGATAPAAAAHPASLTA